LREIKWIGRVKEVFSMRRKEGQWYSGNIRKKQIEKDRV